MRLRAYLTEAVDFWRKGLQRDHQRVQREYSIPFDYIKAPAGTRGGMGLDLTLGMGVHDAGVVNSGCVYKEAAIEKRAKCSRELAGAERHGASDFVKKISRGRPALSLYQADMIEVAHRTYLAGSFREEAQFRSRLKNSTKFSTWTSTHEHEEWTDRDHRASSKGEAFAGAMRQMGTLKGAAAMDALMRDEIVSRTSYGCAAGAAQGAVKLLMQVDRDLDLIEALRMCNARDSLMQRIGVLVHRFGRRLGSDLAEGSLTTDAPGINEWSPVWAGLLRHYAISHAIRWAEMNRRGATRSQLNEYCKTVVVSATHCLRTDADIRKWNSN